MDAFRALPQLADTLSEMVAAGEARLATVVMSYPGAVDAQLSDGAIGRFASTHNGLNVGQAGVLIKTFGGERVFTPLALHVPKPQSAGAYIQQTYTTAGTNKWDNAAVTVSGLIPGKLYKALVSVTHVVYSTAAGGGTFRYGWVRTDWSGTDLYGGTDAVDAASSSVAGFRRSFTFELAQACRATTDGTLIFKPAIQWGSGTVYWQWAYITVTVFDD